MSERNNGGPAFPIHPQANPRGLVGMTLRDYFAAKAMQGWMATYPGHQSWEHVDHEENAKLAYAAADAMLKERAK